MTLKWKRATKQKQQKNGNRAIWLVYWTDRNAPGFWLVKRTLGWKNFMPEELSRNCFDVILQHDWSIEQCLLHIRVFFGGKTKRPCFDLFIHWLIKQLTNTYRNHFSRASENRSTQTDRYFPSSNDHVDMEVSPHQGIPTQSWIRDSTPWIPHSRRRIPVSPVSGT